MICIGGRGYYQEWGKEAVEMTPGTVVNIPVDVLVAATPTYFMTINGMLKNTIDRFLPKWQDLGGHDVYLQTRFDQRFLSLSSVCILFPRPP